MLLSDIVKQGGSQGLGLFGRRLIGIDTRAAGGLRELHHVIRAGYGAY